MADYFALIDSQEAVAATELTPRVSSLVGVLAGAKIDERDYRRHLEEKYR